MLPGRLDRPLLILVVFILAGMGLSTYKNWSQMREDLAQGLHARTRLLATTELISRLKDAETGQRGYLLTGSDEYLAPYYSATAAIPGLLDQVTEAADPDPQLKEDARLLRQYSEEKLAELASTISVRRDKGFDAALEIVRTNQGRVTMDSIRTLGAQMVSREFEMLNGRRTAITESAFRTYWLTAAGLGCSAVLHRLPAKSRGHRNHSARIAA